METKIIYEPAGRAREYSPLAANLYRGCGHACRYCYAPFALHMKREEFHPPVPRKKVLELLAKDARILAGDPRPVLLCFSCDPYQPLEEEHQLTRSALQMLGENGLRIRILSKNGRLAVRDLDLMARHDVEFGVTCVFTSESDREHWEPHAGTVRERLDALAEAGKAGLRTWVSVEPVIDPEQALALMDGLKGVGVVKIGKLNYDKEHESAVDWRAFLEQALRLLTAKGQGYYVKNCLWEFADEEIRARYPRATGDRDRAWVEAEDSSRPETPTGGKKGHRSGTTAHCNAL